jgi:hypothetical protein
MCNLSSMMRPRAVVAALVRATRDHNNNQPPSPGIYPDHLAPVVRTEPDEWNLWLSDAPRISACAAWPTISYSAKQDSAETVREIIASNAARKETCG